MRTIDWLKRLAPPINRQTACLLVLPLVVSLSLMISVGPELQHAVFSTLGSSAPTIYDAAYAEGLVTWPRLSEWMALGFYPLYLLIAGLTTAVALRANTFKSLLVAVAMALAALLTLADVIGSAVDGRFVVTEQLTNIAANLLGGVIASLLIAAGLAIYKFVLRAVHSNRLSSAVAAIALVAFGGLTNMAAYYALRFLYNPTRAEVSAILAAPVSGDLGFSWQGENAPESDALERTHYFDFLPASSDSGYVSVENFGSPISARWQLDHPARSYRVELRLLSDCTYMPLARIPSTSAFLVRDDVRTVAIESDLGGSILRASTNGSRDFRWLPVKPNAYVLDRSAEDQSLRVSHAGRAEDHLGLDSSSRVDIGLSAIFYRREGDQFVQSSRTVTLRIDDEVFSVRLEPDPIARDRPYCGALGDGQVTLAGNTLTVRAAGYLSGTLVLTMSPHSEDDTLLYGVSDSELDITGGRGWFSIAGLENADLEGTSGEITLLSARGSASEFVVDGVPIDVRPYQQVFLVGELRARYLDDGRIRISGGRLAAWLDQRRLNSTRWERLRSEWQLALLGAAVTFILGFGAWIWRLTVPLADDDVRTWLA